MADVTGITAVRTTQYTQTRNVVYGATIAAGNTLVKSAGKSILADADASVALASAEGIAITPGVDTGYGIIAFSGSVVLVGATLAVGTVYIVSDTPGGIKPIADATAGDYITILGVASTATQLDLNIVATGVEKV